MSPWNVANAGVFQLAWFACVLGGANDSSLWGAVALAGLVAFAMAGPHTARDLLAASVLAAVGFILDTAWIRLGVLDYAGAAVAPPWIVMLWAGVGLMLNHCLSMFKARPWLGGALAGAGAPLSYMAGERFGAVAIPDPWQLGLVGLAWLVIFCLAFYLSRDPSGAVRPTRNEYERAH